MGRRYNSQASELVFLTLRRFQLVLKLSGVRAGFQTLRRSQLVFKLSGVFLRIVPVPTVEVHMSYIGKFPLWELPLWEQSTVFIPLFTTKCFISRFGIGFRAACRLIFLEINLYLTWLYLYLVFYPRISLWTVDWYLALKYGSSFSGFSLLVKFWLLFNPRSEVEIFFFFRN